MDDQPDMLETCRRILATDYRCLCTTSPQEALGLLEAERPDLLLTDLRMPDLDGLDLLRRSRQIDPFRPVIMLTAFASIESAVAAVRAGAFDYLPKPFSIEQLKVTVERALQQRRLTLENQHLREQLQSAYGFDNVVGASSALRQVLEVVRKAARSEASILVLGESGAGKELIARAIHANSPRAAQPFVPVDCASLPENLLESELFGHERGAFTGAIAAKSGLFELANKGTIFLDEIGELPLSLQAKLLRVLQERRIRRLGGTRELEIDVRVVSATNRDLRSLVATEKFREDLFYRLNVIDIPLPPLRERKGDVALLAHAFLKKYGTRGDLEMRGFSPEAMAGLEVYRWPGNVRELQNVIERACALAEGELIMVEDLPLHLRASAFAEGNGAEREVGDDTAGLTLKEAKERWLGELEASYLADLLERNGGNVSEAARIAGVDRKTMYRLLNKHNVR